MTDIEKEVITWHKETFPNATTHAILVSWKVVSTIRHRD